MLCSSCLDSTCSENKQHCFPPLALTLVKNKIKANLALQLNQSIYQLHLKKQDSFHNCLFVQFKQDFFKI